MLPRTYSSFPILPHAAYLFVVKISSAHSRPHRRLWKVFAKEIRGYTSAISRTQLPRYIQCPLHKKFHAIPPNPKQRTSSPGTTFPRKHNKRRIPSLPSGRPGQRELSESHRDGCSYPIQTPAPATKRMAASLPWLAEISRYKAHNHIGRSALRHAHRNKRLDSIDCFHIFSYLPSGRLGMQIYFRGRP